MCSSLFGGSAPSANIPEVKTYEQTKDTTATVTGARDKQKEKAAAALGQLGTVNTSPFGVAGPATTSGNSLLGAA